MEGQIEWLVEVGRRRRLSQRSESVLVDRQGEIWHKAVALPDARFDLAI